VTISWIIVSINLWINDSITVSTSISSTDTSSSLRPRHPLFERQHPSVRRRFIESQYLLPPMHDEESRRFRSRLRYSNMRKWDAGSGSLGRHNCAWNGARIWPLALQSRLGQRFEARGMHRSELHSVLLFLLLLRANGLLFTESRSGQVHWAASVAGRENSSAEGNGNSPSSIRNACGGEQYSLCGQGHSVKMRHMQKRSLTRCGKAVSAIPGPLMKSFDDLTKLYPVRYHLLIMTAFQTLHNEEICI
jgi:hypothetical protein